MKGIGMYRWLAGIFRGAGAGIRDWMPKSARIAAGGRGLDGSSRNRPANEQDAVIAADALRDAGRYAEAAEAYAAALFLTPVRNDLRVQRANMLKDAGRVKEAAIVYRVAECIEPAGLARADIRLQCARALLTLQDHGEAAAFYQAVIAEAPETELGIVAQAELKRLRLLHLSPYWL